jgi:iron(III) transport system substrate-binding protein
MIRPIMIRRFMIRPLMIRPIMIRRFMIRPLMIRRRTAIAAAVACGALGAGLLTGCSSSGSAGSDPSSQSITLFSGQHEQTVDGLVTAFEKQTGITVNVRSDDEDTLADQIALLGSHSPADVFYTENSPPLEFLQEKGLLSPVTPATLAKTTARYNSPQGDWLGVSARVSVLIYNPSLIAQSQLPTSVLQLANPKYKGKLAFAPAETDFQPIVTSVLKTYGKAATLTWLDGIKSNAASHIVPDNETIADEVNRGQVAFGVINQYYWYRLEAEVRASGMHSQITHFAPHDAGYVIDVSGAAVLKSSKHQAAAQKFVAFLASTQGQEIIARASGNEQSYEYPLGDGVTTSAPETPFDQLQPTSITIGELGDGSTATALLRQAGLL